MNERRNPPTRRPNEQRSALFRGQLMRRPITQNTASQAEANRLENAPNVHDETSDIVVRDQQGEIELGDPPTPILEDFNEDAIDEGQEVESKSYISSTAASELTGPEERQRLAEAVNSHRISHSIVPEQQEGTFNGQSSLIPHANHRV